MSTPENHDHTPQQPGNQPYPNNDGQPQGTGYYQGQGYSQQQGYPQGTGYAQTQGYPQDAAYGNQWSGHTQGPPQDPKSKSKLPWIILAIVAVLLVIGIAVLVFVLSSNAAGPS